MFGPASVGRPLDAVTGILQMDLDKMGNILIIFNN
jgi:hypothetical protein